MPTGKKVLLGGLGALTPIILNLMAVDVALLLDNEIATTIGYAVRVLVLFYLGGIVAYLHTDEKSPIKLFELGIAAPAIITAMMNAHNLNDLKKPTSNMPDKAMLELILSTAYAGETPAAAWQIAAEQQSGFLDKFWEGFSGSRKGGTAQRTPDPAETKRRYYVVVSTENSYEEAAKRAENFNARVPGFHAEPYRALNGLSGVLIGSNLSREQAIALRDKAVQAGFPSTSYVVWKIEEEVDVQ